MGVQDKYIKLISLAKNSKIEDLSITENEGVLHVSGKTSASVRSSIWNIYNQIDPDMRSGDLVLDLEDDGSEEIYEVKPGDNLSKIAGKYPGMTWQKIFEANKAIIEDPNKIYPGQKIRIPRKYN